MAKSPDPNNTKWKNDTSGFGYQMMLKMGWKEGCGLGKNLQGPVSGIKTSKQFDRTGLGTELSNTSDNWLETKSQYADVLARLNSHYQQSQTEEKKKEKKKEKRKERKETTEKEGKRKRKSDSSKGEKKKRKRKGEREEKKKKRKLEEKDNEESDQEQETSDGETGAEVLKSRRILYPRRTSSKIVSLFSQSDLDQILANTPN
mmetsp:Transcript_27116/g.37711  ORF Transcript_27116/g.37711 Transcript_27116/m.37711 type:complete len:203 (-) Transcript_27116:314-922(-)